MARRKSSASPSASSTAPSLVRLRPLACDQCGPLEMVLIDGYAVGDRLLEGVLFELRAPAGVPVVTARAEDAAYLKTLNKKLWLQRLQAFVESGRCDVATCPTCQSDTDVILDGPAGAPSRTAPAPLEIPAIAIPAVRGDQLFDLLGSRLSKQPPTDR